MIFIKQIITFQEKKKIKVERAICEEMVNILQTELPKVLKEELIEAKVDFSIVEIKDT